ncbi:mannitol-1-phosphate 5-dehydrogenase [Treponema primitia]|uniref:mannitol dehydrogenase family protein n=1 Tax=Treponema primitia TaxID=88058 RepID=UPI00025554A0|nr:mannitol-1-phosphate 5-dehydrogenase [Treponema primitia]
MKFVQFGGGNIGRSFIGALFSRAAWEVVFVDVDPVLVSRLNQERYYTVVIKRDGKADESRSIGPVRAVDGRDIELVSTEIADADIAATSVGKNALPKVLPVLARGLEKRFKKDPERPLDIIIAENDRSAPELFRNILTRELGPEYPFSRLVGLVETSIGKMVPLMRKEDLAEDSLRLFAEEYETLILDKKGFKGPLPEIAGLCPVEPIEAYVDRKLFVHNLGHAATAYLGYQKDPREPFISGALKLEGVEQGVRAAMNEAADALVLEYPKSYSRQDLRDHIEDLLSRFKNSALGDTVHRVGRDLRRKLSREDRLVGAMLLCAKHNVPFGAIAAVYKAALNFAAADEKGLPFPADAQFRSEFISGDTGTVQFAEILQNVSGLDSNTVIDKKVIDLLKNGRIE